ncbi:MAG: M48 family peptidase [Burkholderiaceae bacterium]|nr:MAG: M48 family peptidase [Burkholderiaceae bacterium]
MFTFVFIFFLFLTIATKLWLTHRQLRHVSQHRNQVPPAFADRISLTDHQKAADYTVAKLRLGTLDMLISTIMLIAFTLLGGIDLLNQWLSSKMTHGLLQQIALIALVILIGSAIDLPLAWVRQFRLEERFGFNRMTLKLWLLDLVKGTVLSAVIGLPLLAIVLALMNMSGTYWWFYAWLVWAGFNLLTLVLYPTLIAPWFNKFEPLTDATLAQRIENLLKRCGFKTSGLFVMDGSKRSSHGNAYFTGLGKAKRIVFFDTLVTQLSPGEIEAVLAHELGHFKHAHVVKRIVWSFGLSLAMLAVLGWLVQQPWFYTGLGVTPNFSEPGASNGLALLLFFLSLSTFTFPLQPLSSWLSRRHEYEADHYAAQQTSADDLVNALVKLYKDNASTLTPDPVHSAVYDSHPPALLRVEHLRRVTA